MKQSLLYLACILCFAIDSIIPGGLGVWDYTIAGLLSSCVIITALMLPGIKKTYIIKKTSYTIHISSSIYCIECVAFLAAVMVGSEYIKYTGFWFTNYGPILNILNVMELLILLAGVPVGDIYNSLASGLRTLRRTRSPVYQCANDYPLTGD